MPSTHLPMIAIVSMPRAMRVSGLVFGATLTLLLVACDNEAPTVGFGLQVQKPAGWTYVSGSPGAARDDRVSYDADAIERALATHAGAPLFALLKRAPPQGDFNPTFGINLERDAGARGKAPLALLRARVAQATAHGAFSVSVAPALTRVAGRVAAHAELRAEPRTDAAAAITARVRLHLMVVDDVIVLAAATDAPSAPDDASHEFEAILDSLRLPGAAPTP
ncbi:MAG: hypothetical protein IPG43_24675 [Proteobacteria bacterium]|nr:hypothetical protein [Pseudomonadota bacterium]